MKISTLAAFGSLALSGAFAFTVACDDGGTAVSCTSDADCANEVENTVCDTDVEVCVVPDEPVCEDDTDCDLQDTGTGSPVADPADFANGCEADDFVTIVGFDGNEYCAQEDTVDFPCAATETAVTADKKAGGTVSVCVLADGTCDEDGQCG